MLKKYSVWFGAIECIELATSLSNVNRNVIYLTLVLINTVAVDHGRILVFSAKDRNVDA